MYYQSKIFPSLTNELMSDCKALVILTGFALHFQLGTSAMDNTLLKYSAKDHFFKAVLCHLCIDFLNGQLALNKYKDMQPAFADSRECKFLEVSR